MKKGLTSRPKWFQKGYKDVFHFPQEIPVKYNELSLGTIKIDFEPNIAQIKTNKEANLCMWALQNLNLSAFYLPEQIELTLKTQEKYIPKISNMMFLSSYAALYVEEPLAHKAFPLSTDDEILEAIRSGGPISLLSPFTQSKIQDWISDKDTAGVNINKLRGSLLEYALGSKNKLLSVGRPKTGVLKILGKNCIKEMYDDLLFIMKHIKTLKSRFASKNIRKITSPAFWDYWLWLIKKSELEQTPEEKQRKIKEAKRFLRFCSSLNMQDPISKCIESDEDMRTEFIRGRWEPNKLAKKILARILDISLSQLDKILYSRKEA